MGIVKLTVTVLVLTLLLTATVFSSGFENTGIGTTARGMGGAFRAVSNDWSAAYYNPAGLAYTLDNQWGISLGLVHHRQEITPNYWSTDQFGNQFATGFINENPLFNKHEILNNPSSGFILRLPVWGETVFGFSIYQPFDHAVSWRLYDPSVANFSSYNPNISGALPNDEFLTDLDVVAYQLTAAREFNEKLSLGLGLQVLRTDLVYREIVLRDNPGSGAVIERPREKISELSSNELDGASLGFTLGGMFKATEKITVGASIRIPLETTLKGSTELTYYLPFNDDIADDPSEVNTVNNLLVSGQIITLRGEAETKIKLPVSFGGGVSFALNDKLTLALDAEYTLWSQYEGFDFVYSNFDPSLNNRVDSIIEFFTADLSRPAEWENAGKVALGAKYEISPILTLLAGASMDQSPLRETEVRTPHFIDTGDKLGLNGGFVFHVNQWDLGVVVSYYDYPDESATLVDINGDGLMDSFPGLYKAELFETILSINYRF